MTKLDWSNYMNNSDIRKTAKVAKLPLWAIADAMNVSEATMTRMLRRELPEVEKQRIMAIIHDLSKTS